VVSHGLPVNVLIRVIVPELQGILGFGATIWDLGYVRKELGHERVPRLANFTSGAEVAFDHSWKEIIKSIM
jgi:hypothetical protein